MRPHVFAFFSGAGFLDLGFEAAGHEIVFANEINGAFLQAHQFARRQMHLSEPRYGYSGDSIESFLTSPLLHMHLGEMVNQSRRSGNIVGFIGGPPCPDFSVGGKNRGKEGENGRLSSTYVQLICEQQPDFFLFENVKGLWRTKRHRAFFDELRSKLRAQGYETCERLINSLSFGVPQDRERIILIGFKRSRLSSAHQPVDFPWENCETGDAREILSLPWPTTAPFSEASTECPPGLPLHLTVESWFRRNSVDSHPNSSHIFQPRAGLKRFLTVDEGDVSRKSYKRLHRWRYSPTACYGNNEVHIHPYKPRRISVAEALAIQSLPKEFSLPPTMTLSAMFKTVGNGVPFLAAKGLASSMMSVLETTHATSDGIELVARNLTASQESRL